MNSNTAFTNTPSRWVMACLTIIISILPAQAFKSRLVKVSDSGFGGTSVNTAIFRANSVASRGNKQYVAFYDSDSYLTLASRTLGSDKWQISRSQYKGNAADAHNVISIAVDGDGYLHVAFDHHGHKLKYCRSVSPESLALGNLQPMTGENEDDVTYPEFYNLSDGSLMFAYRSGASGRGNLVLKRYDTQDKKWESMHSNLIDGENQRNAYWQIFVDAKGTIHISWVWRESWLVETNHDICYARSTDNGKTWEKSDGTPYELPITAANAEYAVKIPQNSELINQTSMSADSDGNPYIASYWRGRDSDIPQYRIVWHKDNAWHQKQLSNRTTPFSLKGGGTKMIPIARPRMVIDGKKVYYLTRDAESGSRVTLLYTSKGAESDHWKTMHLTDFEVPAWEPTFDNDLWRTARKLHIFVQPTIQGDGEKRLDSAPQPVYILEFNF